MLEIQRLRSHKEEVLAGLSKRNINATNTINELLEMDVLWRENKTQLENISAELNQLSRKIGDCFKNNQAQEAQ